MDFSHESHFSFATFGGVGIGEFQNIQTTMGIAARATIQAVISDRESWELSCRAANGIFWENDR